MSSEKAQPAASAVQTWTTEAVPETQRIDYYADVLSSSLAPMHLSGPDPVRFHSEFHFAELGPIGIVRQFGSQHVCYTVDHDISRRAERSLHLVVGLGRPMLLTHRGEMRIGKGDVALVDTDFTFSFQCPSDYAAINLKLPEHFVKRWVPSTDVLLGRNLLAFSQWGAALCSLLGQLTPEWAARAPLPGALIADQIGSLLALVASDVGVKLDEPPRRDRRLSQRIQGCIAERSAVTSLTAGEIARELGISPRTVHRALAAEGQTFAGMLMRARIEAARRMLESPLFKRLTVAEIGRRAGFADPSHFTRVFRRYAGANPTHIRRA